MNWVSEDYVTEEGKPIGIGGDPRGATAEKGEIILETSAEELLDAFETIRNYSDSTSKPLYPCNGIEVWMFL